MATPDSDLSIQEIDQQYLTFTLADEEYGLEILSVQEIKSWAPVTPIPCAPSYLLGVMNLRGAIVPVIDLRNRLGLPSQPPSETTAIIIIRCHDERDHRAAGIVVDSVADVQYLNLETIQKAANVDAAINPDFISALAQNQEGMIILLNTGKIVSTSLNTANIGDVQNHE